ncbi:metallophosphoesterase [Stackebrandtia nassauensis]|uniref:Metallophosphoesterase n=1 Tax=Stackebrandtia nassauensis (strain DSM 44728 / CIP 108903 / NRRL B-16338 / NBRC 102104 / LLR-40K-21) TaxID=446470 RepID=D3Q183_STANL|nr:metallophosphoesterase [Stackebrandtia nassauensis]ADD45663.1 metallophosphoesterase [Stackebrandtia nassauensis DSM 44728]
MVLLAQISDLHLDGSERATQRAVRTMEYLRGLATPVDALLVTGDIADHAEVAEYEEAARLLKAPFPVLMCPGNHDARGPYREVLLGEAADEAPVNRVHRVGDIAVLMCDSTIPGRDDGELDERTREWIAATLTELGGTPALVAFHHPMVNMHHPFVDSLRLRNGEELAALLSGFENVVAILTGHTHTAAASSFAGLPLRMSPSVTYALRLPWEGDEITNWEQPPGVAFHVVDENRELITHFRSVA